jgi:MATE family multidrug resistance protein
MATTREEDDAALSLLPLSQAETEAEAVEGSPSWWRQWATEAGRVGYLALPMLVVSLSQYAVQVSSNMMVGHLPGVLPLSSAAVATSLATVSGSSVLVRTKRHILSKLVQ